MKTWLRERRLTLLLVGVGVPALSVLSFRSLNESEWPFWLACFVIGFPAGIFYIWARQRGRDVWERLERPQRILLRCVAIAVLWCLLVLLEHDRSDRLILASSMTALVVLFWGGYMLFSRTVDTVWSRIRRR